MFFSLRFSVRYVNLAEVGSRLAKLHMYCVCLPQCVTVSKVAGDMTGMGCRAAFISKRGSF